MIRRPKNSAILSPFEVDRRSFLKVGAAAGTGLLLGNPGAWAQDNQKPAPPAKPKTNLDDALQVPRTGHSLPGPFPGKVVQLAGLHATSNGAANAAVVKAMFENGMAQLFGANLGAAFGQLFTPNDVVGLKVNPVGPRVMSTRLELVDAVIDWLTANGLPRGQIVIWDRFDYMLRDAGFTPERFPGIQIEGLQTMDDDAAMGKTKDNSRWLGPDGRHLSEPNFDDQVFYFVDVDAPTDEPYLNQHVFNGKYSYFGKLITQKLTKIINLPVFKNTGNGISMATKNIGYGGVCNTGRLHRPLFFDVCTEVPAFPVIRDKLVLNITDGLIAQYDGGPDGNANFTYPFNTLFFATDPFALDYVCQQLMVEKRKAMGVKVNEHPIYTEYLRYAERLGLGIADPQKIEHIRV